jgi:hypothetical protein
MPASDEMKRQEIARKWPHAVPYALEFDLGPVRALGFEDVQRLAELFQVDCGRVPSRYITTKPGAVSGDPHRQLLTVLNARTLHTFVEINGQTVHLVRARHRVVGHSESSLDFTKLRPRPETVGTRRRVG